MNLGIAFAPLVPAYVVLIARSAVAVVLAALLLLVAQRAARLVRALALALLRAGARQSVLHARGPRAAARRSPRS